MRQTPRTICLAEWAEQYDRLRAAGLSEPAGAMRHSAGAAYVGDVQLHIHEPAGAGEGARTLDIDLGKVALYH